MSLVGGTRVIVGCGAITGERGKRGRESESEANTRQLRRHVSQRPECVTGEQKKNFQRVVHLTVLTFREDTRRFLSLACRGGDCVKTV